MGDGMNEACIIVLVVAVLFGPGLIAARFRALGRAVRETRQLTDQMLDGDDR